MLVGEDQEPVTVRLHGLQCQVGIQVKPEECADGEPHHCGDDYFSGTRPARRFGGQSPRMRFLFRVYRLAGAGMFCRTLCLHQKSPFDWGIKAWHLFCLGSLLLDEHSLVMATE